MQILRTQPSLQIAIFVAFHLNCIIRRRPNESTAVHVTQAAVTDGGYFSASATTVDDNRLTALSPTEDSGNLNLALYLCIGAVVILLIVLAFVGLIL